MSKPVKEENRVRRQYSPDGTRGQKHIAFRCDYENIEWLYHQSNKGRYINNLIAADRQRQQQQHKDD